MADQVENYYGNSKTKLTIADQVENYNRSSKDDIVIVPTKKIPRDGKLTREAPSSESDRFESPEAPTDLKINQVGMDVIKEQQASIIKGIYALEKQYPSKRDKRSHPYKSTMHEFKETLKQLKSDYKNLKIQNELAQTELEETHSSIL